jgi:hypothetical protein
VKVWTHKLGLQNAYDELGEHLNNGNNNNNNNTNNSTNKTGNNVNSNNNSTISNNNPDINNYTTNDNNSAIILPGSPQKTNVTWHWELPLNITVRAKFDHILYHNLECVRYGVKISGASDHYPIFAHFVYL